MASLRWQCRPVAVLCLCLLIRASPSLAARPRGISGAGRGGDGGRNGPATISGCAVVGTSGGGGAAQRGTIMRFERTACEGAPASAVFALPFTTRSGWGQLSVTTAEGHADDLQMRAAGFLEGFLTAPEIAAHHDNVLSSLALKTQAPLDWLEEQDAWTREEMMRGAAGAAEAGAIGEDAAFWAAMRLLMAQFDGLVEGYTAAREERRRLGAAAARGGASELPALDRRAFLFVQAIGDMGDLAAALDDSKRVSWGELSPHAMLAQLHTAGRCSALIKVTDDLSDLLMGHAAWFTFGALVRIYKHFSFALAHPAIRLRGMTHSGYPGELSSDDDFYLLSTGKKTGIAVLQTTNSVMNHTIYDLLTPKTALSWQRARMASFLARTGPEWAELVGTLNSGTGNNQWMVVDLNLFEPGKELPPGLLTVVETLPGLVAISDQTEALVRGYWPSYNIPFHPSIYNGAGYPQFVAEQSARGEAYANAAVAGASYQLAPRAKIFRRDVGGVVDLPSLQAFLRSNDWPDEEFSGGTPLGTICGRGDLDPQHPKAYGCIDAKVASFQMALRREALGVVGPTDGSGKLPPFSWSHNPDLAAHTAHAGQAQEFDFSFELLTPDTAAWAEEASVLRRGGQAAHHRRGAMAAGRAADS